MSRAWGCVERGARLNHDGFGDVDAASARALAAGPREDACILGFVPEIGLENLQTLKRGEVLGEQTPFVVRVIPRRRGTVEIRKALADAGPEIPVSGPRCHGCAPGTSQFQVPSAKDNRRLSPLLITSPATVGASEG